VLNARPTLRRTFPSPLPLLVRRRRSEAGHKGVPAVTGAESSASHRCNRVQGDTCLTPGNRGHPPEAALGLQCACPNQSSNALEGLPSKAATRSNVGLNTMCGGWQKDRQANTRARTARGTTEKQLRRRVNATMGRIRTMAPWRARNTWCAQHLWGEGRGGGREARRMTRGRLTSPRAVLVSPTILSQ